MCKCHPDTVMSPLPKLYWLAGFQAILGVQGSCIYICKSFFITVCHSYVLGYWMVPGFVGTTLLASCSLSLRNVLFSKWRVEKARSMRSNQLVQVVSGISSVRSTVICSIPSGNKKHKTPILVNCALVKTCKNVLLQIN